MIRSEVRERRSRSEMTALTDYCKDKHVLLIVPKYFGYETAIANALDDLFLSTSIVFENIEELSSICRVARSHFPQCWSKITKRYYEHQFSKIKVKVDLVFIIRGSSLGKDVVSLMKELFPEAGYLLYEWDGVANLPNAKELATEMNWVFTFDISDSRKYGWTYRPLFYLKESSLSNRSIDCAFIGTLHTKRAEILSRLIKKCDQEKLSVFDYVYVNRFVYLKNRFITRKREFANLPKTVVPKFSPLSLDATNAVYSNSRIVVDYTHPGQTGYTMRTIECIGHRCKLMTNNRQLLKADFYNPSNVFIYDEDAFEIDTSFFESGYQELPGNVRERYSLKRWIEDMLSCWMPEKRVAS